MKVKICCNNGANIHSKRTAEVETSQLEVYSENKKWENMTDDEKYEAVKKYIDESGWIDIWYE